MKTTLAKIHNGYLHGASVMDKPEHFAEVQAQAQHIYYALSMADQVCAAMETLLAGDYHTDADRATRTRNTESLRRVLTKLGF